MPASGLKQKRNPWLWVPSLYFIEGLPNAIVATVAMVLLKNMGITNDRAAFYTSLLYLPWIIKPFWAPFIDMFATKRRWVIAMQVLMSACLGLIALTLQTPAWLAASLAAFWMMAFSSATHDIAADGFYILALSQKEQDFFVGIRSTAYRLAGLFVSGGIVWMAGQLMEAGKSPALSWQIILIGLCCIFIALSLWHGILMPRTDKDRPNHAATLRQVLADFGRNISTFFTKKGIGVAILFLMLYRLPEALLSKLTIPFLQDPASSGGLGLTTAQLGIANGTAGMIGGIIGGIVGGIIVARYGLRRCIWPMALSLTLPSAFYCYLAAAQPLSIWLISIGIAIEQFGYIFGYTAMMVYMLRINENSPYSTSHFAFCTGIAYLGLMLPGLVAGIIQMHIGFSNSFALVMALCPATYLATYIVRKRL